MSKNKISIIFGSDTGTTDFVANVLSEKLGSDKVDLLEVNNIVPDDFLKYDIILMGVPTWHVGELQSDWDYFFPKFKKINFSGIKVAFFGLGDQLGYPDTFVDGIGILGEIVLKNGGDIFGYWSQDGYDFDESLGIASNDKFYGLVLDEDNQQEMTDERIDKWVNQIKKELKI